MKLMVKGRKRRKITEICRKLFYTIVAIVAAKGAPLGVFGGWVGGIFLWENNGKQWENNTMVR